MDVEKRTLISAGMDASGIKTGMAEAAGAVTQSTTQMSRALLDSGRGFDVLAKNFVSGYKEALNFAQGIQNAYRAVGDGRDKLNVLPQILDGIAQKWGLVGTAARQNALIMIDSTKSAEERMRALQALMAQASGTVSPTAQPITQTMVNQFAGVKAPLAGDDLKDRQADIEAFGAAYGKQMDDMRAKFSPVFAAQRQYQATLADIATAEKLAGLTATEAAAARTQAAATYTNVTTAATNQSKSFDHLAGTTRSMQFAMRDLGLQSIDVFQGLATGAPILTTLIQQGAQVVQVNAMMGISFRAMAAAIGAFVLSLLTNPITLFIIAIAALGAAFVALVSHSQNAAERLGTLRNQLLASRDDATAMAEQVERAARRLAATTSLSFAEASKAAAEFAKNPAFQGTQRQLEALATQSQRLSLVLGVDLPAATKIMERGMDDAAGAAQTLLDQHHFGAAQGVTQAWVDSLKNMNQAQAFQALSDKIGEVTRKSSENFTELGRAWQRFLHVLAADDGIYKRVGDALGNALAFVLDQITRIIQGWQNLMTMLGSSVDTLKQFSQNTFYAPRAPVADTTMTGNKEHDLAIIRQRESGDQNIPNQMGPGGTPLSTASGHYQIIDSTWLEGAKMAGVDIEKYRRAINAPFEIQHQVAGALYDRYGATPWAASAPRMTNDAGTAATEQRTIDLAQAASKQALQRRIDDNAKAQRDLEEGARVQDTLAARARERAVVAPGGVDGPEYKAASTDYDTAIRSALAYRQQLVELKKAQYDLVDPQEKMARSAEDANRPLEAQEGMARRLAEVYQQFREEAKGTGIDMEALSRAQAALTARGTIEIRDQVQALDLQTNALRAQISAMEEGGQTAENAAAFERAIIEARKAGLPGTRQNEQAVKDLTEAYRREIEVKHDVQAATDIAGATKELEILATEARLIGATTMEREKELAVIRTRQSYGLASGQVADAEQQRAIDRRAFVATTRVQNDELTANYNELASATSQAFNTIGSSITDAFMNGNGAAVNFLNIFKSIVAQIIQEAIKLSIINPILRSLFPGPGTAGLATATGVFGALSSVGSGIGAAAEIGVAGELGTGLLSGGLFARGGVFANGSGLSDYSNTIVSQPTLFSTHMSGLSAFAGGAGLMGEAGPEAILPLVRGPSGSLGVRSEGGGGGNSVQINTPITVNAAPGAGTGGQPAMDPKALAELQRQLDQTVRNAVRAQMVDQKRPGGDLYR